jgi:hypothetical protein
MYKQHDTNNTYHGSSGDGGDDQYPFQNKRCSANKPARTYSLYGSHLERTGGSRSEQQRKRRSEQQRKRRKANGGAQHHATDMWQGRLLNTLAIKEYPSILFASSPTYHVSCTTSVAQKK